VLNGATEGYVRSYQLEVHETFQEIGIGTTHWLTDCWNIDPSADLAEVNPILTSSFSAAEILFTSFVPYRLRSKLKIRIDGFYAAVEEKSRLIAGHSVDRVHSNRDVDSLSVRCSAPQPVLSVQ